MPSSSGLGKGGPGIGRSSPFGGAARTKEAPPPPPSTTFQFLEGSLVGVEEEDDDAGKMSSLCCSGREWRGGGKLASLLLFLPYPFLPFPSLSPLRLCHGKTFSLLWESMEIQLWLILSERKKGNGRDERKTEKVGRERGLARK